MIASGTTQRNTKSRATMMGLAAGSSMGLTPESSPQRSRTYGWGRKLYAEGATVVKRWSQQLPVTSPQPPALRHPERMDP
jgi:hypothetical protein